MDRRIHVVHAWIDGSKLALVIPFSSKKKAENYIEKHKHDNRNVTYTIRTLEVL